MGSLNQGAWESGGFLQAARSATAKDCLGAESLFFPCTVYLSKSRLCADPILKFDMGLKSDFYSGVSVLWPLQTQFKLDFRLPET